MIILYGRCTEIGSRVRYKYDTSAAGLGLRIDRRVARLIDFKKNFARQAAVALNTSFIIAVRALELSKIKKFVGEGSKVAIIMHTGCSAKKVNRGLWSYLNFKIENLLKFFTVLYALYRLGYQTTLEDRFDFIPPNLYRCCNTIELQSNKRGSYVKLVSPKNRFRCSDVLICKCLSACCNRSKSRCLQLHGHRPTPVSHWT